VLVHIPLLEALLEPHAAALGRDAAGYRNHAYRVVNLAWSLGGGDEAALQRLVTAAAFHDLGIWSAGTLDYIDPSRALALAQLRSDGHQAWSHEVDAMIANHHRLSRCAARADDPVERFRRADWADVSGGLLRRGFDKALVACLRETFPSKGFHCGIARRVLWHALRHPLNPLPMLRR
jgi:hypothetical protein